MSFGPADARTITIRLQVIGPEPRSLDVEVPTYLTAADLSHRVATDVGLPALWPDNTRRRYWFRVRGRVMRDDEKLEQLGVVPYELVHMLPEPPQRTVVAERTPEYPNTHEWLAAGYANALSGGALAMLWVAGWSFALSASLAPQVILFPAIGLGLLWTSTSRYLWGGLGSSLRIPITALVLVTLTTLVALIPVFRGDTFAEQRWLVTAFALMGGSLGIFVGWLAWYGPVEPLPETVTMAEAAGSTVTLPCAVCGGEVTRELLAPCAFGCGRVFHQGCLRTRQSLHNGAGCAVCGYGATG